MKHIVPRTKVTIGQPIAGWSCDIVNPDTLEVLPEGEAGEMLYGSAFLAKCYLHKPELTAEKFIQWTDPQVKHDP